MPMLYAILIFLFALPRISRIKYPRISRHFPHPVPNRSFSCTSSSFRPRQGSVFYHSIADIFTMACCFFSFHSLSPNLCFYHFSLLNYIFFVKENAKILCKLQQLFQNTSIYMESPTENTPTNSFSARTGTLEATRLPIQTPTPWVATISANTPKAAFQSMREDIPRRPDQKHGVKKRNAHGSSGRHAEHHQKRHHQNRTAGS